MTSSYAEAKYDWQPSIVTTLSEIVSLVLWKADLPLTYFSVLAMLKLMGAVMMRRQVGSMGRSTMKLRRKALILPAIELSGVSVILVNFAGVDTENPSD